MSYDPAADERYARQVPLPGFGPEGQRLLAGASVLCVGAGGLGAPVLTYLSAMGVGRITVVDDDRVTASNLARQTLYGPGDVDRPKVEVAAEVLTRLNPLVRVEPLATRLDASNVSALVAGHDVVVEASDNFDTRHLLGDACLAAARPYVWGAIWQYDGRAGVSDGTGPCFRCLFPEAEVPAAPPAVFAPVCAVIGAWQAGEVVKIVIGTPVDAGRIAVVDLRHGLLETLAVAPDPLCQCRSGVENA